MLAYPDSLHLAGKVSTDASEGTQCECIVVDSQIASCSPLLPCSTLLNVIEAENEWHEHGHLQVLVHKHPLAENESENSQVSEEQKPCFLVSWLALTNNKQSDLHSNQHFIKHCQSQL